MKTNFLKKLAYAAMISFFAIYSVGCSVTLADTEDIVARSFNVGDGGVLTVDVSRGSIEVIAEKGNVLRVKVIRKTHTGNDEKAEKILKEYKIDFDQSGNNVTITSDYRGDNGFFSWLNGKNLNVKYIISVPQKYDLDLKTKGGSIYVSDIEGNVKVKTSGGSLKFDYVKGPVRGTTSGGSITLDRCIGNVDVKTSGGSIRIGRVEGEVRAYTSGGSIKVEEVMGTIDASTSGGSITASITKQPTDDCKLTTSGGSVNVHLAQDIKVNVDAKTSAGRVSSDFAVQGEVDKHGMNVRINGGGPRLYLRTSGGSIRVNRI